MVAWIDGYGTRHYVAQAWFKTVVGVNVLEAPFDGISVLSMVIVFVAIVAYLRYHSL